MKRGERIYAYIQEKSAALPENEIKGRVGFDAQEIAEELGILRNNVSKELNELHRQGKIVKFAGRPVRYFDRETLEKVLQVGLGHGPCQFEDVESIVQEQEPKVPENPFARLIGADRSLKRQVEQAKAAILYPPDGLHTLIVGQTGVGKTLFAHMMFEYGKAMHRFAEDAPFVTFNCADYYNNPQLLISHVFGYVKGAFTGAEQSKAGLVEEADGGVLFLDEIHRLPPEGQEMIFYFMDTGTLNRLGETRRDRRAKVLIIGATTEDPDSALTKTFVRRIPNIMKIPPLVERTLAEKLDIIKLMFQDEAQRVKKPIRVGVESIKALVGSIGNGNVGQLKSNIKLLCAQAFLNGIDSPDYMEVDFKMLPQQIRNGLLTLSANRQALTEVTKELGSDSCIIVPPGPDFHLENEENDVEPFNLYQVVEEKVELLKGEGISSDLIKQIVATDVNVYVRTLYNKKNSVNMTTRERLLKIVDESLIDFSEQVALYVQKRMNRSYHDRFLYAFSLHLSAFLKRVKSKDTISYTEIEGAVPQDSLCLEVAMEIGGFISKHYHLEVPRVEIEYIALLLESAEDDDMEDRVVIVVATHGQSTATSMVEVAQRLFGTTDVSVLAVDMPLEVKPQEVLDKMFVMLRAMRCLKGVLILADMGSLCNLGPILAERLEVPVRTIDMVSTPLILEAMRKAELAGMDLEGLYDALLSFHGYETSDITKEEDMAENDDGVIVTICSTGQGTALKLKALVEDILGQSGHPLTVIPVGLVKLEEHLREIAEEHHIVAAVGVKKPQMEIPFIPLEALIDGNGENTLMEIVGGIANLPEHSQGAPVVRKLCEESLRKFLTYLNPDKVMPLLLEFDHRLMENLPKPLTNPLRIRLLVHCGCALERAVMHKPLHYDKTAGSLTAEKIKVLHQAAAVFEASLQLHLADDEIYFMAEMI
ncbi:sigma-54-dependent transcriptional regulator [Mitsuokella sp.]|uniref:sigma-54-dependent transcriptional regulator n=1 Tax=Mitsuokella sp. TaxID=2049034 RepID=UPI003D7C8E73